MSAARFGFRLFGCFSLAQDPLPYGSNYLGLPVSGLVQYEEGSPLDACFYLRTRDSKHLGPQSEASRSFRNCFEQWLPHRFFSLLLHFRRLVRFSFDFFQAVDQNFCSSDDGADRPYGTGFQRSADTVDEAMRLCGRPGFHSVDQILSSIRNELRRLGRANEPRHRHRQKLARCRLSDPGFLFLLAFAANLAHRTEHSATKRASVDRRVLDRYLVAFAKAHSATSTISLFVAILVFVFVGIRPTIKNFIGTYTLAALALIVAAELAFGISGHLSESLGRGSDSDGQNRALGTLLRISGQSDFRGRI